MNKTLLPVAIALALPMTAMADVTIYGRAHVSIDWLDDGADYSELNLSSNTSRLGFKGQSEFGEVTAMVQVEQQIDINRSNGESFSTRDTFVGLKGDFGMIRFGQFDSPFKKARDPANLFGDSLGDMRNLTRVGDARFDERMPNTLHYQTPSYGGLRLDAAYSAHEGNDAGDGVKDQGVSVSATYAEGPLEVAVGFETYGEDSARGKRDAMRLAGAYGVTSGVTVVGFYQTADHENDGLVSDVIGLGAELKVAANTRLKSHYLVRSTDLDSADSELLAVGLEHRLDNALRVYLNYAMMNNEDAIALTPWSQARTTGTPGTAGETASGLSMGLRYDF